MKKKTRKIIVGENEYLYVIDQKYNQQLSNISLKISLKVLKNITCTFFFCTWDDPITGSPLLVGTSLTNKDTNKIEKYNLHNPRTIRDFILYGLENGWTGKNVIEFQDGLDIIGKMRYDISWLEPVTRLG